MKTIKLLAYPVNGTFDSFDYQLLDSLPKKFPKNAIEINTSATGIVFPSTYSMRSVCRPWNTFIEKYFDDPREADNPDDLIDALKKLKEENHDLFLHIAYCLIRPLCPLEVALDPLINAAKNNGFNCLLLALPFSLGIVVNGKTLLSNPIPIVIVDFSAPYSQKLHTTMHEIGHVIGLDHCPNRKCVMHPLSPNTPSNPTFCSSCLDKIAKWRDA